MKKNEKVFVSIKKKLPNNQTFLIYVFGFIALVKLFIIV